MLKTHCENNVAEDVGGTTTELVGNGNPEKVTNSLQKSGGGEEIRDLANRGGEKFRVSRRVGAREEAHGSRDDRDGRSGGEEVAHHHGDTDDC